MRVFITGASGLLGLNSVLSWSDRHEIWGSYLHHPIDLPGNRALQLNLADVSELHRILKDIRPDVVIHAAALSSVDACEQDPRQAHCVNAIGSCSVAKVSKLIRARLIHISSDQVFDGAREWYSETDRPCPLNAYGRSKLAGEQMALQIYPDGLVIRTNFFGWGPPYKPSLTDWALARFRSGSTVPGFTDVFFSPILINDLLAQIEALAASSASGLLNLGGANRLSKYTFLQELARSFDLSLDLVRPATVADAQLTAPRPRNMSLASNPLTRHITSESPTVVNGLTRLRSLEQKGWPNAIARLLYPSARI